VVLPISCEATLREVFHELARATSHPALGLSLVYGEAGEPVVVSRPPPQRVDFDDEHDYETAFRIAEDPISKESWSTVIQQASCFQLSLPAVVKQHVASFLLTMRVHKKAVSDAIGKYTADHTRIGRWKDNFGSCHQRCSATDM
jgi:hypothetical protein